MKNLLKNHKGITLIALVITIIVLLILAGVTIAAITSNESAPNKAVQARDENERGAAKDAATLLVAEKIQAYYEGKYAGSDETARGSSTILDYLENANVLGATNGVTTGEYAVKVANGKITVKKGGDVLATGSVDSSGVITWDATPVDNTNPPVASNLSQAEQTALSANGMAELTADQIDADTNLEDDQKTALKDTTKIKAVLTGNVPVPVGYSYVEGTSTAPGVTKPDGGSWGVVINDNPNDPTNGNEWVWVPVNVNESVAPESIYITTEGINVGANKEDNNNLEIAKNINGLKIASITEFPSLKVADDDSSSSSYEESGPTDLTDVTTRLYGAPGIINNIFRYAPYDASDYREPALVTDYDGGHYQQAGFETIGDMAHAFVDDYETMIESIITYGGFYVGRYELSGTNNGSDYEIINAKVQAGQAPMDRVNWYRLYQACRTFGTETTTSTMIWGTQWDLVCNWTQKVGDQVSYSNYHSNRHSGDYSATTGSNINDIRNNVCDLEGSRYEWTQEAYGSGERGLRGGSYSYLAGASNRSNNYPFSYYDYNGSRPSLYINVD